MRLRLQPAGWSLQAEGCSLEAAGCSLEAVSFCDSDRLRRRRAWVGEGLVGTDGTTLF